MSVNNKFLFALSAFFITVFVNISAQNNPVENGLKAINEDVIRAQLSFIASDWTEGREAGTKGERLAGDYIAIMLQLYGVKPFGDVMSSEVGETRTYFQNFVILKTIIDNMQIFHLKTNEVKINASTTQVSARNILGIIEGKNPDQYIVLGAHYDHLGMRDGQVWNGADDNASGTAGILTIAKAIAETGVKPEKSIIFAFWTAEELGLLGSRYYLENLNYPINRIKLNLNFDMISRYVSDSEPRSVTMTYTDKYLMFKDITASNLEKYDIDLTVDYQPSAEPPGGSDHRSFIEKGIPVMRFKPGHREEYHTPADKISTINWDIMEKIIKISFLNIWYLANSEW